MLIRAGCWAYFPEDRIYFGLYRWRAKILAWCGARLGREVLIARNFRWQGGDNLEIGDRAAISYNCKVLDFAPIEIGSFCRVGTDVTFSNGAPGAPESEARQTIGTGCWIGSGAAIVGAVKVGDYAVIGAGSLVTSDVPAKAVVFGAPARVVWKRKVPGQIWYEGGNWYDTETFELGPRRATAVHQA